MNFSTASSTNTSSNTIPPQNNSSQPTKTYGIATLPSTTSSTKTLSPSNTTPLATLIFDGPTSQGALSNNALMAVLSAPPVLSDPTKMSSSAYEEGVSDLLDNLCQIQTPDETSDGQITNNANTNGNTGISNDCTNGTSSSGSNEVSMTQIMAEIAGLMNQEAGETAAQTNAMMYSANAGVVQANDQATDIRDAGYAEFNAAVNAMITGIVLSVAVICIGGYATAHSDDTASDTAAAPKQAPEPVGGETAGKAKPESAGDKTDSAAPIRESASEDEYTENATNPPDNVSNETSDRTALADESGAGTRTETPSEADAAENNTGLNNNKDKASVTDNGAGKTENNAAPKKAPSTLAKTGKGIMSLMKSPLGIQTVMGSLNNLVQLSTTMITAAGQRTAAADNAAAASAQGLESYYSTSTSDCLTNLNNIASNLSQLQQDEASIGSDMSSMVSATRPG
jgi:hypothetical protein